MAGTKRGNGAGSVFKKREKPTILWGATVTLADGTRKTQYAPTQEEAQKLLTKMLRDRDLDLPAVRDERQTLGAYLASWLEVVKAQVRESAWISYEHRVRLYVIPRLGRIKLAKLTPQHVRELHAWMLDKGLSAQTTRLTHGVLSHALSDAVKDGTLPRNVAALVDPPRRVEREMLVYTPAQVDMLLKSAQAAGMGPIVTLAVTTGLRLGEALALRWRDVELDAHRIHVRKGRSRGVDGWIDADPKTNAGKRSISLTSAAVDALRAHRKAQLEHRIWLGESWQDLDYVFANSVGGQQFHSVVEHAYYRVLADAGLPRIRWHDLRHTAATLLLLAGVPVAEVSEMLGHADPSVTYRVYAHTLRSGQRQAVAAMEKMLGS
ncbi:MAG TPA: site-specific integrase [Ktedonobacterales bacterium]|jgi:integrase